MSRYDILIEKPLSKEKKKRKPVKVPEKKIRVFFKTTHRLKKTFKSFQGDDMFRKGSRVYIPRGNQGSNQCVWFVTPGGKIRGKRGYDKKLFEPRGVWFEKV